MISTTSDMFETPNTFNYPVDMRCSNGAKREVS